MKIYDSKEYLEEQIKNKSYLQIAKENGISRSTIGRKLIKFKLTSPSEFWNEKEIQILKENYSNLEGVHLLFPNRTKSSVYHFASRIGLNRSIRKRYYDTDENFFKKWTNESSYALGWMFSDGNVAKDRRTFGFHLHKKDIKILKILKELMNSKHKIFLYGNAAEFRIHSKKMCGDLISLGCMPNKTFKIKFPKKLPKKYLNHFIRGYFDGDGSISFNYPNAIKIKIVGNKQFIEGFRKKVVEMIKTNMPKMKKMGKIWQIEFYGDNARKFCSWIYKDCDNLFLERKYKRFENHLIKRGEKNAV